MNWQDAAAALAFPLTLWLAWRLQTLAVEFLRRTMAGMIRFAGWLYSTVSWCGTLLHETSHAIVLLVTGHGIKDFSVKPEEGHVMPRRVIRNPLGRLGFMLAAFAPMLFVPALVLAALVLLLGTDIIQLEATSAGYEGTKAAVIGTLANFPESLGRQLLALDLSRPSHLAVVGIIMLGAPGMRPSHVKNRGLDGGDQGDIAVIRRIIRREPLPFILLLTVTVGSFALTWVRPSWYWWPVQISWAIALTGIIAAVLAAIGWGLVAAGTRTRWFVAWIPPAVALVIQIWGRQSFDSISAVNALSLASWAIGALALRYSMPRTARLDI